MRPFNVEHCRRIAFGVFAFLITGTAHATTTDSDGIITLDGLWLMHAGDDPSFAYPELNDFGWQQQYVPISPSSGGIDWQGYGWYRLHLHLEEDFSEEKFLLSLGPAREVVEVFVNGRWLGSRGGFGSRLTGAERLSPFVVPIPTGTLKHGDNVVAVRLYDPSSHGGLTIGPMLLGPPRAVLERLGIPWGSALRKALGIFALFIALSQLVFLLRGRREPEHVWSTASGLLLGLLLLDGTGVFRQVLAVDLSARATLVLAPIVVLCLGSFVVSRYDDFGSPQVTYMRGLLIALSVVTLLLPNVAIFVFIPPVIAVLTLATSLYCVHLCVQAVRRGDVDALPMLIAICGLTALVVYDGWSNPSGDVWPPAAAVGGIVVLGLATSLSAGRMLIENREMLRDLSQRDAEKGDTQRGLLASAAMRVLHPEAYLNAAIQELARELAVRRCSLVLKDARDDLRVCAAVGLPNHLKNVKIDKESIAAYVYTNGTELRPENLPPFLADKRRNSHNTTIFRATPVKTDGKTIGVLNISDRNDGGEFETGDEIALLENIQRLGLMLSELPHPKSSTGQSSAPPQSTDPTHDTPHLGKANEPAEYEHFVPRASTALHPVTSYPDDTAEQAFVQGGPEPEEVDEEVFMDEALLDAEPAGEELNGNAPMDEEAGDDVPSPSETQPPFEPHDITNPLAELDADVLKIISSTDKPKK